MRLPKQPPLFVVSCLLSLAILFAATGSALELSNCKLQSTSAITNPNGAQISNGNYNTKGWYNTTLPSTVMAALVSNGVYKEPFYGLNLQNVSTSLFDSSWWYRCEFQEPMKGSNAQLTFKGINYKANVWFNGQKIGDVKDIVGTFRYFDFDVTALYNDKSVNTLAVETFKPIDRALGGHPDTDLAISFVDWAPNPPDANMGLWRAVSLSFNGGVTVRYPQIETTLSNQGKMAHLNIMVELENLNKKTASGTLEATIEGIGNFKMEVTLDPMSTRSVFFKNESFPALNVPNPQLWWPRQMGNPTLHKLSLAFTVTGESAQSDNLTVNFGMRQATSELTPEGYRLYKVNNKPILIRGAGWSPDLFYRMDPVKMRREFQYIVDLNLNAIRLEGKFGNDYFFELADSLGILLMPGWCCCDAWQHWSHWGPEQYAVSGDSLRSQIKRLRVHPSILVFLYSSDELPPAKVENEYLQIFKEQNWVLPTLASASEYTSPISGPTGVKMSGPYAWVPPDYWYIGAEEKKLGGAFGFLTEGGPGGAPMTYESLADTIPSNKLWPINEYWNYHCGNAEGLFGSLKYFTPPQDARYGKSESAKAYLYRAQVAAYEGHRAMFEAYSQYKYHSTGVIQWMLNNAWPEMIWHLYDYYLNPGGSYFGTKKALTPVNMQYNYYDDTIWAVNSVYSAQTVTKISAILYNVDGSVITSKTQASLSLPSDGTLKVFDLPKVHSDIKFYFIHVTYHVGDDGFRNTYWKSSKGDVLDWKKSTFYQTACKQFSDFKALEGLPKVNLESSMTIKSTSNGETVAQVTVTNPTPHVAFFIHVQILDGENGKPILPVMWQDNMFTLFASESVSVSVRFPTVSTPKLSVQLWNNVVSNN